jgi:hypothetical protein
MIRVANTVEKNIDVDPADPIVVNPATPTDVLFDISKSPPSGGPTGILSEYVGRYIQNVGANNCYYAFGQDCNPTNYHGILVSNGTTVFQQLDCSNHGRRVSVYSVSGTIIAPTVLRRADLTTKANILQGNNT